MAFPLAFEIVRTKLASHTGIRCVTDVPATRPSRFISIDASPVVGGMYTGVKARVLSKRRLLIYAWGTSETDAGEMAENAIAYLRTLPEQQCGIRRVDTVGEPARRDYIVNDQIVQHRYCFTVDVVVRANP